MAIDAVKNRKLPKKEQFTTGKTEKSYNSLNILYILSCFPFFLPFLFPSFLCVVVE